MDIRNIEHSALGGPGRGGGGGDTKPPLDLDSAYGVGIPHWISSLEEDLDSKVMVVLRDERKLLGFLRSFDQFGNLVTEDTKERFIAPMMCRLGSDDAPIPRSSGSTSVLSSAAEQSNDTISYSIYADMHLGTVIVRGDNIVLFGTVGNNSQESSNYAARKSLLSQTTAEEAGCAALAGGSVGNLLTAPPPPSSSYLSSEGDLLAHSSSNFPSSNRNSQTWPHVLVQRPLHEVLARLEAAKQQPHHPPLPHPPLQAEGNAVHETTTVLKSVEESTGATVVTTVSTRQKSALSDVYRRTSLDYYRVWGEEWLL